MVIQKKYLRASEGAIASYDYTDIAEGTGMQILYGFDSTPGIGGGGSFVSGGSYHLTSSQVYSTNIESPVIPAAGSTFAKCADLDFDLGAFNLPKTVEGTAFVSVTQLVHSLSGGGSASAYIHAYLYKWDGTTETALANASGAVLKALTGTYEVNTSLIPLTISQTHFKKGEQIRLNIQQYAKQVTSVSEIQFTHDPKNSTPSSGAFSSARTTTLELHVPFKIDL
jgi:hypothetical protein